MYYAICARIVNMNRRKKRKKKNVRKPELDHFHSLFSLSHSVSWSRDRHYYVMYHLKRDSCPGDTIICNTGIFFFSFFDMMSAHNAHNLQCQATSKWLFAYISSSSFHLVLFIIHVRSQHRDKSFILFRLNTHQTDTYRFLIISFLINI